MDTHLISEIMAAFFGLALPALRGITDSNVRREAVYAATRRYLALMRWAMEAR